LGKDLSWNVCLVFSLWQGFSSSETGTDYGFHQTEINGTCECEDGYHWNEHQTSCIIDNNSHNFIWKIDTLENYDSYLNDIAIIDKNNIWVVWHISGNSSTYNTAQRSGSERIVRIRLSLLLKQNKQGKRGICYYAPFLQ